MWVVPCYRLSAGGTDVPPMQRAEHTAGGSTLSIGFAAIWNHDRGVPTSIGHGGVCPARVRPKAILSDTVTHGCVAPTVRCGICRRRAGSGSTTKPYKRGNNGSTEHLLLTPTNPALAVRTLPHPVSHHDSILLVPSATVSCRQPFRVGNRFVSHLRCTNTLHPTPSA